MTTSPKADQSGGTISPSSRSSAADIDLNVASPKAPASRTSAEDDAVAVRRSSR
ncbi:hypothetical protein ACRAWF_04250 [Streptomyces sp. L7]